MRWKNRRSSSNIEDRRGTTTRANGGPIAGGALGSILISLFRRGSGKTKLALIGGVIIACFVFKMNPLSLLGFSSGGGSRQTVQSNGRPADPRIKEYFAKLKGTNEDIWQQILPKYDIRYRPSKMVIYTTRTHTAGGIADARMGPFYMPADETIYIDPTFFDELKTRFGAKGDFAEAYVIAHEVGHHIQKILKLTDHVHNQKGRIPPIEYNQLSVRLELHADFLSGIFAHHAQEKFNFLETGDIQEAMDCAEAIGDDRIQSQAQGHIQPDLFTHGTSAQRKRWFMRGYRSGDLNDGNILFSIRYQDL
ncbi:MAG: neutral zinc metallopeptidase [Verrucomicrobiae bacterium]|nr:neutral zinc metallopeptidase [Verrucomicrobiae bacterium]NNJ43543.1 flagellar biosynthesis protein FlgM [Akkermansiaceae bacterium]